MADTFHSFTCSPTTLNIFPHFPFPRWSGGQGVNSSKRASNPGCWLWLRRTPSTLTSLQPDPTHHSTAHSTSCHVMLVPHPHWGTTPCWVFSSSARLLVPYFEGSSVGPIFSFLLWKWLAWGDERRGNGGLGLVKFGLRTLTAQYKERLLKTPFPTLDCMSI